MNLYSLVFSPTGGTQKASDALCAGLDLPVHKVDLCDSRSDYSSLAFSKEDICVFSVPSFGGRVPVPAAQRIACMHGNGALAVLLVVYGNRAFDDTFAEMMDLAEAAGFRCVAGAAAIAEHSIAHCYATGRPDEKDIAELKTFGRQIMQKLQTGSLAAVPKFPGHRPYRAFGGVGMIPMPDASCMACGTCASLCPTGAISTQNPAEVDSNLCISCMRCVAVCPTHSRRAEPEKVAATEQKLSKLCSDRKANELFL